MSFALLWSLFPEKVTGARSRTNRAKEYTLTVGGRGETGMDVDPPESHGEAATTREDDFAWTCGGDAKTKHIKKINHGAFGDVHMVTSIAPLD